jgi:effector-binding domain-containing protein
LEEIAMNGRPIFYKHVEPILIAFTKTRVENRDQILPLLEKIRSAFGDYICGDAMVIFHGGAVKDGFVVEAGYPVTRSVETETISTRLLENVPVLSTIHQGPHQTIRETVVKVYDYLDKHAWTTSLFRREIYHLIVPISPERNVTEIQIVIHEWDRLLAEGAEQYLGVEARRTLMQGIESITPNSTFTEYTTWIAGAMHRLDALTDDPQVKCRLVANCAHVFPQERIDHLREVYLHGEFDDILREMYCDDFWYEKPVRRGNVLFMRKNPFDPEGYGKASSTAERRRAYCHCSFVHPFLDEIPSKLSPTFCYCGSGWYTRLWEGILGEPVKIEHVETLLRGNDQCTLTITLPLELRGECLPGNGL